MDTKDYLSAAYQENRDKWLCADSWYADDFTDQGHIISQSAAYIIQIVCSSEGAKESAKTVDIGDSYTNRTATNFGQDSNITITSTIVGTTYAEFLAASEEEPFVVGRTMIISTSAGQLENPVAITHRNANGDADQFFMAQHVDPYQNLTDRVIDNREYIFDGMTRLRIRVNGSATVTVRFYLISKFTATQIVANRPGVNQYAAPHLIKAAPSIQS